VNISPLDIRKHTFKKVFRGLDPDEVTSFLDIVSMEYENVVQQNSVLNERVSMLESQLNKFRDIEKMLQETLITAERTREDTLKNAKKQAEIVVREAEVRAASIVEEGRSALIMLRTSFGELKMHKDTYLAKLKSMVSAQSELFQQFTFPEEKAFDRIGSAVEEPKTSRRVGINLSGDEQKSSKRTPLQQIEDDIRREGGDAPGESGTE
jgi:cell division initiation protein